MLSTETETEARIHGESARSPRHWVPLKNTPGELLRVDKRLLHIDEAYQRKINRRQVHRVANNWSWIACGVLLVSRRPKQKENLFVVDGQHRHASAMLVDEVIDLPCLLFDLDTVEDEAIGFLAANTERKVPTLGDQFNALLLANDRLAHVTSELAKTAGRTMGAPADKLHISCVGEVFRAIRDDEGAIRRVWPIIVDVARDRPMPGRLIRGMQALERRMAPSGQSLSSERWTTRLGQIGYDELLRSIGVVAGIEGNSSERVCAQGILRALNKGLRNPVHVDLDVLRR